MVLVKKIAAYWFFLITLGLVVYFCISNLEFIYVKVPHIGEFKTRAAFAFLTIFMLGLGVSGLWFSTDLVTKSIKIRRLTKKLDKQNHSLVQADSAAKNEETTNQERQEPSNS